MAAMADVTVWDILTAAGATGSFAVLCLLAARIWSGLPNFMDRWLALKAARAAEKAADWTRMRDLLKDQGGEIHRLSEAEKQCRADYAELHGEFMDLSKEVATLRGEVATRVGYQIGRGEAAQDVTIIESSKRLSKDKP